MRINGWTAQRDAKSESAHSVLPPVEGAMAFNGLLQKKILTEANRDWPEQESTRQQRLACCFSTLLEKNQSEYKDAAVHIARLREGRLRWRFLSGPFVGCDIDIEWGREALCLLWRASGTMANRLKRQENFWYDRLSAEFPHKSITVKVICETGF